MDIYPHSGFMFDPRAQRLSVNNNSEESFTYNSFTLQLEGLNISQDSTYPAFISILLSYFFIVVANVGIAGLIVFEKSLHQPMYLLFCNLATNDFLGASAVLPRLLVDMLRPPAERLIGYRECVLQAFSSHVFGTSSHTVLIIMAFDRYVAICNPLRYAAIMTHKTVVKLTLCAWGVALVLVGILLGLTVRLSRCRTFMQSIYCNNGALFQLSCESVVINNVYGLTFTVLLFTASVGSVVLTYMKITIVCLTSSSKALNRKALKTCSTHLLVYVVMFCSGLIIIILQRFPQYSDLKKQASLLFHIIPSSFNPIIYAMQSKEIQKYFSKVFHSNKVLVSS